MGREQVVGDRQGIPERPLELEAPSVVVALGQVGPVETALAQHTLDVESTGQPTTLKEHALKSPRSISDPIIQETIGVIAGIPPSRRGGQGRLRASLKEAESIEGAVPPNGQPALPIPGHPPRTERKIPESGVQIGPEVQSKLQSQGLRELGFRPLVHAVDHEVGAEPNALLGPAVHLQQKHRLPVGIPHEDGGRLAAVVRKRLLLVPDKAEEPIEAREPDGAGRLPDKGRARFEGGIDLQRVRSSVAPQCTAPHRDHATQNPRPDSPRLQLSAFGFERG